MLKTIYARKRVSFHLSAFICSLMLATPVLSQVDFLREQELTSSDQTIADLLSSDARLSTLKIAVEAAGLTAAIAGPGPFTLFAPVNQAFANVNGVALNALLSNKQKLTSVLSQHLVRGDFEGRNVPAFSAFSDFLKSVDGSVLSFARLGEGAYGVYGVKAPSSARIIDIDILASNGRIHLIENVIVPFGIELPAKSIVEEVAGQPQYSTLVKLLQDAGLVETIRSAKGITVFAPTNDAFKKLSPEILDALSKDPVKLKKVLVNHVVNRPLKPTSLAAARRVETLGGNQVNLKFHTDISRLVIDEAQVDGVKEATNGYVYTLRSVLVPVGL